MDASDPNVLLPPVEHHKWKEAPEFLRQLILLLERCWPTQLHFSGLREYHPFLYTLFVCSSIATVFFVSFFFVHVALYRRLACHYPILQVLFRRKESGTHHDRHGDKHGRSRPHRASASTTFRPTKFATANRSSHSSTTPHHSSTTPHHSSTTPHHSSTTPHHSSTTPHHSPTTPHHSFASATPRTVSTVPSAADPTHEDCPSTAIPTYTSRCTTTPTHEDLPSNITPPITHSCATTPTHEDLPSSVTPPITHLCTTTPTHEDLPSSVTPPITHLCTTFTHMDLSSIPSASTTLLTCPGAAEDLSLNSPTPIASHGEAAPPNEDSPTTSTNGGSAPSSSEGVTVVVRAGEVGECPSEHTAADR